MSLTTSESRDRLSRGTQENQTAEGEVNHAVEARTAPKQPEPIAWPDGTGKWWWMRYRRTPRAKWRVVLVSFCRFDGQELVAQFQDRNWLTRGALKGWSASFVPAMPPPEDWCKD